jgi:hypothetical protein
MKIFVTIAFCEKSKIKTGSVTVYTISQCNNEKKDFPIKLFEMA